MSVYHQTYLVCDECEQEGDYAGASAIEVRQANAKDGWVIEIVKAEPNPGGVKTRRRDLCGECDARWRGRRGIVHAGRARPEGSAT